LDSSAAAVEPLARVGHESERGTGRVAGPWTGLGAPSAASGHARRPTWTSTL